MRLGTETGSLVNHVLTHTAQPVPTVGMPATVCSWTDRSPATVARVSDSGKRLWVTMDAYRRIDSNGMSENQDYEYTTVTATPENEIEFRLGRKGWKRTGGSQVLSLGHRERYYDFSS